VENTSNTLLQAADAWDTADAPDKFFAYVPDDVPSHRKLPLASVQRKDLDPAILRNAIARFTQTDLPTDARAGAKAKICAAVRSWNRQHSDEAIETDFCGTEQGGKKGDSTMDENKEQGCTKCTELEAKIRELEEQAKAPSEREKALEDQVKKLSEWQAAFLNERLDERARKVIDLELQAGLVDEKNAEEELARVKKLGIPALEALTERFEATVRILEALPTGPKAKYDREQARSIEEDVRQAMFGIRRDWKQIDPVTGLGNIVGAD